MKKIRLIELFGGIGCQAMALKRTGLEFETYRYVDNDRFAVASYNAIHGTNFEPTDITKVSGSDLGITDTDHYNYILCYSFPCTDISVAGKMAGYSREDWENGKSTRSGLLWEVERILEETVELPQFLLMENVTQVHCKKNMTGFVRWLSYLESRGYKNYIKDMNAKDYGVAQSRNRCFMLSILNGHGFSFPEPVPLQKTMRDYLEDKVDECFYVNKDRAKALIQKLVDEGRVPCAGGCFLKNKGETFVKNIDVAKTLMARDYKGMGRNFSNGVVEKDVI